MIVNPFHLRRSLSVLLATLLIQAPARAQLLLPGALQASPSTAGNLAQNPSGAGPGKPKPDRLKPPSEGSVVGHDLSRDGFAGTIAFQSAADKGLEITRLSLAGEEISRPGEPCRVDVVADAPIQARFAGRPHGVSQYEVAIEACPFSFDVLDGAVNVMRVPPACDFPAADCRAAVAGLWGPPGGSFGPGEVKQLESARGHAESQMRAAFRALLKSAGKDKDRIKKIAGEQAGFSSERDVMCRDYLSEDVHGFCALRITQARALALQTAIEDHANLPAKPARAMTKKTAAEQRPASVPKRDVPTAPRDTGPQ